MAINKVVYGNNTLVDLTNDTVEANNLLEGETAHNRSGNLVTGTAKQGHTIQNASGTAQTQRANMQFPDSFVSDDDVNGRTVVENVKEVTLSELSQATERGMYLATDEESVPYPSTEEDVVSVTADGQKTYSALLDEIYNSQKFDKTKLTDRSNLQIVTDTGNVFNHLLQCKRANDTIFEFISPVLEITNTLYIQAISLQTSGSTYINISINSSATHTPETSNKPASGTVIALHYGTSSGIVELNTDARHCMMSDGVTSVEDAIGNRVGFFGSVASAYVNMEGGQSYTATVNCWFTCSGNTNIDVAVNGIAVAGVNNTRVTIPLKAGDVVTTNAQAGTYAITYRTINMLY